MDKEEVKDAISEALREHEKELRESSTTHQVAKAVKSMSIEAKNKIVENEDRIKDAGNTALEAGGALVGMGIVGTILFICLFVGFTVIMFIGIAVLGIDNSDVGPGLGVVFLLIYVVVLIIGFSVYSALKKPKN